MNAITATGAATASVNTTWFKAKLRNKGVSQRILAEFLDMDPAGVCLMLNGKRSWNADAVGKIAKYLDVTYEEVLRHAGLPVSSVWNRPSVIVDGVVDSSRHEVRFDKNARMNRQVFVPMAARHGKTLKIRTMGLGSNWIVHYKPVEGVPLTAMDKLCVVQIEGDNKLMVRHVTPGSEDGFYRLRHLHGGIYDFEDEDRRLKSASPILWIQQQR